MQLLLQRTAAFHSPSKRARVHVALTLNSPRYVNLLVAWQVFFFGTSSVESDFSIIRWEKDDNRSGLTDFSLKGILQAKQAQRLQNVYKLVI